MLHHRALEVFKHYAGATRTDDDARILATKADVEKHFEAHGTGEIKEIKLMNGFGFIEYVDPADAMDVVPGKSSSIRARRVGPDPDECG